MQPLDRLGQLLDRREKILAVCLLLEHDPHRGDLARQELGLGQRAGVGLAVALDLLLVTVGLAVLREQDQRRRVRRLRREHRFSRMNGYGSTCFSAQSSDDALSAIQTITKIVCIAR